MRMLPGVICLLVCHGSTWSAEPSLKDRLAPLAQAHKGKVAVAVKHLVTGESYYLNADQPMPTASLIKVAVMIEVYQQAAEGKLKLSDRVTLRDEDRVPGSGILTPHFSAGAAFPLRDAVHLMMTFSDNTATNLVLERVGLKAVNQRMAAWGFPRTRINAMVFRGSTTSVDPEGTRRFGLGSTTAREMVGILEELQTGVRNRPAPKQSMLGHMKKNTDRLKLSRFLPPGTAIAHKGGSVSRARTAAGIIATPTGPVIICVLTSENEDQRWTDDNAGDVLCGQMGRAVYDHFARPVAKPSGSPAGK